MDNVAQWQKWQILSELTTRQLVVLTCALSDELKQRADQHTDPNVREHLLMAVLSTVETRGYLRRIQSMEAEARGGAPAEGTELVERVAARLTAELDAFHAARPNLSREEAVAAFARGEGSR